MASGIHDQGIGTDGHGFQLFPLLVGFRVVEKIKTFDALLDVLFKIKKSFLVDLIIQDRMPRGSLFHEFGEDPGFEGILPLLRHLVEDPVPYGLSPPERDDFSFVFSLRLLIHSKGRFLPCIQYFQVFEAVGRDLRVGRSGLGSRTPLADDELARVDAYGFILEKVFKS